MHNYGKLDHTQTMYLTDSEVKMRVHLSVYSTTPSARTIIDKVTPYNFKNALSPKYMDDIYSLRISPNIRTRRSTDSFVVPFYQKEIARKSIFILRI